VPGKTVLAVDIGAQSGRVMAVHFDGRRLAAVVRCILESLALAYREVLEKVAAVSSQQVSVIHIVGGGSQNQLLNQMTANATRLPVVAGPIEATVIGNALVQLVALGEIEDLSHARQIAGSSADLKRYEPEGSTDAWDEASGRFQTLQSLLNDSR
jgi:rhamnulokinase